MNIKALFTDFYDTIVKDDSSLIKEFAMEISEITGINRKEINNFWWRTFHNYCSKSSGQDYKNQREIEELTVKSVINKFGINKNSDYFLNTIFKYWKNPVPYNDALFLLKKTSMPVYIVSNIDTHDLNSAVHNNNLHFHGTVTSEDTKSYKPDPEIFKTALSIFKLKQNEVFHIGDSLNADVMGAENCGIKSIWINRKGVSNNSRSLPFREYKDLYQFYNDFKDILNP